MRVLAGHMVTHRAPSGRHACAQGHLAMRNAPSGGNASEPVPQLCANVHGLGNLSHRPMLILTGVGNVSHPPIRHAHSGGEPDPPTGDSVRRDGHMSL